MPAELPAAPTVEVGDQKEEPLRSRMDVCGQRRDLVGQLVERVGVGEGVGACGGRGRGRSAVALGGGGRGVELAVHRSALTHQANGRPVERAGQV
jgi:hypothetical protein